MKNTNGTSQSSQLTGAGVQSASVCVFCGASLTVAETYCCSECVAELMPEPDCRMHGGGDEKGQAKM